MNSPLLEVRSIKKEFESVTAVDGLSFDVRKGEIFALLGPNGAGKTTVVRMLLNILQPDEGTIRYCIDGKASTIVPREHVGYLPEERGLYREIPIDRTLIFMGVLRGMSHLEAAKAADSWLDKLDLLDRKKEKLEHLSKGNQQKIQFIASMLHTPQFAILDEPFSGLDPVNQELFLEFISGLRDTGMTILLSAHQMDLVERLADRVLLVNAGRSVLEGPIAQILHRSTTSKIVILRIDGQPSSEIIQSFEQVEGVEALRNSEYAFALRKGVSVSDFLLKAATQLVITDIRSKDPTLHEIFLQSVRNEEESRKEGVLR
jgi:ABC-2 type transport system ATP-binding protein